MPPFNYYYTYNNSTSPNDVVGALNSLNPLDLSINWVLKRTFDITLSLILLICIMPILIPIILIIHKICSPGPLFCIQQRAGFKNQPFKIIKFRTMHLNNYEEIRQPFNNDPRLFPIGKLLRQTGIDEVPQLFNVLKGEMSLIGPRPHLIQHNITFKQFHENYDLRSTVLPGITGLAQVRGFRGGVNCDNDIVYRVNSDIYYVENWSLLLDIIILIRSVGVILTIVK